MAQSQLNLNRQLADLGIDTKQLNGLIRNINDGVACDDECQRQRKLTELENIMNNAIQSQETAPEKVATAKRNYYVFRDGLSKYNQTETERLTAEAQEQVDELKTTFDRRTARTQTLVDEYEAIKVYSDNLDELMDHNITKNQRLTKNIDDIKTSVFTNDRRYHYYEQSINWQWYVNMFVWITYWVFVIVYIGYFLIYQGNFTVKRNVIYGIIILVVPFILSKLLIFEVYGYSISNVLDRFIQLFIFNKYDNYD